LLSAKDNWRKVYRDVILQKKFQSITNFIENRQEEIKLSHEQERKKKNGKNQLRLIIVEKLKDDLTKKALEGAIKNRPSNVKLEGALGKDAGTPSAVRGSDSPP
jgi:hypothetical protein